MTVVAKEKEAPDYKGRVFKKMINNGPKGQYLGRARDRFLWDGILEIAIPSYYTSTACPAHATVDAAMRNGDRFWCPRSDKVECRGHHRQLPFVAASGRNVTMRLLLALDHLWETEPWPLEAPSKLRFGRGSIHESYISHMPSFSVLSRKPLYER